MRYKNNTMKRIALSYVALVLIIVILFSVLISFTLDRNYRGTLIKNNQALLHSTVALFEEQVFMPVSRLYSQYALSSVLNGTVASFFANSTTYPMDAYAVHANLSRDVMNNTYIDGIHLYSVNSDTLISTKVGYKQHGRATFFLNHLSVNTDILDSIDGNHIVTEPFTYEGEQYIHLIYKAPFLSPAGNQPVGYIFFMLKCTKIAELMQGYDNTMYMIHANGTILVSGSKEAIGQDCGNLVEGHLQEGIIIKNSNVINTVYASKANLWFAVQTPNKEFFSTLQTIFHQSLLIGFILLAVGLAIAAVLSYRINQPIRHAIDEIEKCLPQPMINKHNLNSMVRGICDEFSNMDNYLSNTRETVSSVLLYSMYTANCVTRSLESMSQYIQLPLERGAIPFLIYCNFFEDIRIEQEQMLLYQLSSQLKQEVAPNRLLICQVEESVLAGLYVDHDDNRLVQHLSLWKGRGNIRFFADSQKTNVTQLSTSFQQLRLQMLASYFRPEQFVWYIPQMQLQTHAENLPAIEDFTKALHCSDIQTCRSFVERYITSLTKSNITYEGGYDALQKLIRSFNDSIGYLGVDLPRVKELLSAADVLDFKQRFNSLLEEFFAIIASRKNAYAEKETDRIKQYIAEHLADDPSIADISNYMSLSPNYLSRRFKEQTGITLSAYIRQEKLKMAQQLLLETSLTVTQVAAAAGYRTNHYFIKQFKEQYGVTPSVYRKNPQIQ